MVRGTAPAGHRPTRHRAGSAEALRLLDAHIWSSGLFGVGSPGLVAEGLTGPRLHVPLFGRVEVLEGRSPLDAPRGWRGQSKRA